MHRRFIIVIILSIHSICSVAQGIILKGRVQDQQTHNPLPGAAIIIREQQDSNHQYHTISDEDGAFRLEVMPAENYQLQIRFLGYKPVEKSISLKEGDQDLGNISLSPAANLLKEVKVTGAIPATQMKGDTAQFNADAYKVNPDATAEDLIKKMPGITVATDGSVTAQGEDVKKVLVDGKPFFGNDPTLALRNLPSEVIDKVELFDKLSDQAQFTGFDDGNSSKTLNIVTKANKRNGQFGKFYAAYGTNDRYQAGGNLNLFNNKRRISIIGLSNNINQQNFSFQDLLGVMGGGSMRRGPGGGGRRGRGGGNDLSNFLVGQQNGLNLTNSFGIDYSDSWGSKIQVSANYFFNNSNNNADELSSQQYFLDADSGKVYNESNVSASHNYNHRFNLRFDYKINDANSLLITPSINFQSYRSSSDLLGNYTMPDSSLLSSTRNDSRSRTHGYNLGNDILYRHAFDKKGRTISFDVRTELSRNDGDSYQQTSSLYFKSANAQNDSLNQHSNLNAHGYLLSGNISYTEPVGESGQLMLNYNTSYSKNFSDKETYNFDQAGNKYSVFDTTLSNNYNNDYLTNRGGLSYRYRDENFSLNTGLSYQRATLSGNQIFPYAGNLGKSFNNLLPDAMLRYQFSDNSNLRLFYRTSTDAPQVTQLQNVIDNSNPLQLSTGNPELKQAYTHRLMLRYSNANPDKSTNFFAFLSADLANDYIGNALYTAINDSTLAPGIILRRGSQLTKPVNLDGYRGIRSFLNYGFPVNLIKSNLNLNGGFNYTRSPGQINDITNTSGNYTYTLGAVLGSNISENVDFTLSYNASFNQVKNSIQPQSNTHYFSQNAGVNMNLIFWKGLVFQNSLNYQQYKGLGENYDQSYLLWNMSLGKKFLESKRAEIKVSVNDLLNQNNNISRTVTDTYIQDTRSNTLQRYFMLTFTYNLRSFGKQAEGNRRKIMIRPPMGPPPQGAPQGLMFFKQ